MGSEWKEVRLGEHAKLEGGFAFKSKDFVDHGFPVAKIKNVKHREIDLSDVSFIDGMVANAANNYFVRHNDILICMTGSGTSAPNSIVGRVAKHRGDDKEFLINQRVGRFLITDKQHLDNDFLYYYLSPKERQWELVSIATGSANQVNISGKQIENLKIPLPPLSEQKKIAHTLGSLDDKIELNRQMNATLEGMAQALFKSWFVDFDPVIDNALAAGNPIPEAFAARAETRRKALADGTANRDVAKQFPAAFQFTEEMGWIPDGWKISKLKDCTNKIGSGSTPRGGSSAYIDEGIKLVRSQNIYDSSFRWSGLVCITDEAADKLNGVILTERDVLINITGDSILRTCVVDPSVLPARVNQHVAILRPKNYLPKHYLHQYIVRSEYKTYLLGFDAGGSRKAVTKGHLEEAEILLPHYNILDAFSDVVDPFFDHKNKNELQIRTLSSLRDTLLPKLISGEIRIPEAEKLTEEALA